MDHIPAIWQGYVEAQALRQSCVLATLVHTQGSTYRKLGARMLITVSGKMIGMLSGGCLEQDILAHSEQVLQTQQPRLIHYDTSTEEDIRWGFGLGCDGAVKILLDVLSPDRFNLLDYWAEQKTGQIATIFASEIPDIPIGTQLYLKDDQVFNSTVTNAELAAAIAADLQHGKTQSKIYKIGDRDVHVLLEVIKPVTDLTIFGAGRDVLPVVQFAKALDWRVTVVDCRAQDASYDRFAQADRVILTRRDALAHTVPLAKECIAVIMTHNYYDDIAILERLLPSNPRYVGLLGSRQRSQKLMDELSPEAKPLAYQLHRPIGLDLGAETPEEIALSIVAEIQAVLHNRQAVFLKHQPGSIHHDYANV
jgi:xanthine dehydrogenase accessory factor